MYDMVNYVTVVLPFGSCLLYYIYIYICVKAERRETRCGFRAKRKEKFKTGYYRLSLLLFYSNNAWQFRLLCHVGGPEKISSENPSSFSSIILTNNGNSDFSATSEVRKKFLRRTLRGWIYRILQSGNNWVGSSGGLH